MELRICDFSIMFCIIYFLDIRYYSNFTTLTSDVDLENPILHVTRAPVDLYSTSLRDTYCERVRVVGHKRWKLNSYASSFRILAKASKEVPERNHDNIEICFHRNASVGLCQCEKEWGYLQKGQLNFTSCVLFALTSGLFCCCWHLVSEWVPFYYTSSVVLGVLLVVIILLFQVSVFILATIFLAGAALGYWMVRKFVLSKDGNVDAGIAQFVKWVMRMTASIFIFQSTLDRLLALVAVIICGSMCSLITSSKWRHPTRKQGDACRYNLWQHRARQAAERYRRAEYLRRSDNRNSRSAQRSPSSPFPVSKSPTNGFVYSTPRKRALQQEDHFSTFHTPLVLKYSKKRWDDFTRESTRDELSEWACTPEVCDWIAENAHRVHLEPYESSDDSLYI